MQALVDRLRAWDGSIAGADALRAALALEPAPRGRPAPGERGLAKLRSLEEPGATAAYVRWLCEHPEEQLVVAPLLGDPRFGPWPWDDPFGLEDDTALGVLELLGSHRIAVDPAIRLFLRVFLRVRPRAQWTAAARAIARQAAADPVLRDTVERLWTRAFPAGVELGGPATRLRRHTLYLGAAWVARGGTLPGLDPLALARRTPPTDDADRSVLLASVALGMDHEGVPEALQAQLPALGDHPLTEATWVALVPMAPAELQQAIRTRLAEARWVDADGLLTWQSSLRTLQLPLDPVVDTSSLGPLPALELVERVRTLFDPETAGLIAQRERAVQLTRVVTMLAEPGIAELQWADVARAAGPFVPQLPGTVAEVGRVAIGVCSARTGRAVQLLLRDPSLPLEATLALAGLQDGFIATQVAVRIEVALRTLDEVDRVRLLWRLLQADPPNRTFLELERMIRADADPGDPGSGPLVDVVRAVCELDRVRDAGGSHEALGVAVEALANRTDALLAGAPSPLHGLAAVLGRSPAGAEVTDVLIPLLGTQRDSLLAWTCWVEGRSSEALTSWALAAQAALESLRRALEELESARPRVEAAHASRILGALEQVEAQVTGCGWPERHVVASLLHRIRADVAEDLDRGHAAVHASRSLLRHLRLGDEQGIEALLASEDVRAQLGIDDLDRAHRFLLAQLRWSTAARLRTAVRGRIRLPSASGHLVPLFAAVAGGAFLVLDFGDRWVQMAGHGLGARYVATIALTVAMAYAVLVATLGARLTARRSDRWSLAAWRVLPVFLATTLVALGSTVLVFVTLGDLDWQTFPVFSSLALFFGVFFGVVLQGRALD